MPVNTGMEVNELTPMTAMQPKDLQKVLRKAIESVIDRAALNHEVATEKMDTAELQVLRQRVQSTLLECIGD